MPEQNKGACQLLARQCLPLILLPEKCYRGHFSYLQDRAGRLPHFGNQFIISIPELQKSDFPSRMALWVAMPLWQRNC